MTPKFILRSPKKGQCSKSITVWRHTGFAPLAAATCKFMQLCFWICMRPKWMFMCVCVCVLHLRAASVLAWAGRSRHRHAPCDKTLHLNASTTYLPRGGGDYKASQTNGERRNSQQSHYCGAAGDKAPRVAAGYSVWPCFFFFCSYLRVEHTGRKWENVWNLSVIGLLPSRNLGERCRARVIAGPPRLFRLSNKTNRFLRQLLLLDT